MNKPLSIITKSRVAGRGLYPMLKWCGLLAAGLGTVIYPSRTFDLPFPMDGVRVASEAEIDAMREGRATHPARNLVTALWTGGRSPMDLAGARLTPFPGGTAGKSGAAPPPADLPSPPDLPAPPDSMGAGPGTPGGDQPSGGGSENSVAMTSLSAPRLSPAFSAAGWARPQAESRGHAAGRSNTRSTNRISGDGTGGPGPSSFGPGDLGGGIGSTDGGSNGGPSNSGPGTGPFSNGGDGSDPFRPPAIGDPWPPVAGSPIGGDPQGFLDPQNALPPDGAGDPSTNPLSASSGAEETIVGEPMSLPLFGVGLLALGLTRRRRG